MFSKKCSTNLASTRNFLDMDERLFIPPNLRPSNMSSIHYGHPGRDTMLRYVEDIRWSTYHRKMIKTPKCCKQCSQGDEKFQLLLKQSQCGKIPKSVTPNEEIFRFTRKRRFESIALCLIFGLLKPSNCHLFGTSMVDSFHPKTP